LQHKPDAALVITIFEAIKKIHVVDEKLLNAVTNLTGFFPCGFSPVEVDLLMFL
jgi:pyrroline-5-carboxylate reductase